MEPERRSMKIRQLLLAATAAWTVAAAVLLLVWFKLLPAAG